jgi:hypothetical protein
VLLHAGGRRRQPDPDPVGNQPRRTCHHHSLHRGKGRVVPEGRCRRCAELSRRPSAAAFDGVGKSTFDVSLASLAIRGTLALFGAATDLSPVSIPNGSMPLVRSI